jgi:hypothetical protein
MAVLALVLADFTRPRCTQGDVILPQANKPAIPAKAVQGKIR